MSRPRAPNCAVCATSFAILERSRQSEGERYDNVMDDLQMIGRRNMLCGMHVHVEMPDPENRVDVMTRILPYVPLLIALSTSSPFWRSRPTGLQGYRLAAYDELPRTGIPELFKTKAQFEAYSEALVRAGAQAVAGEGHGRQAAVVLVVRGQDLVPGVELEAGQDPANGVGRAGRGAGQQAVW